MSNHTIHVLFCMAIATLAALLLAMAIKHHIDYREAHVRASRSAKPSPGSPEDHFDKAELATAGVVAIAITALIVAVKTRRIEWIACFIVSGIMAAIAIVRTGIRY